MKALFLITVSHLLISVVEGHDGCNKEGNIFIQGETLRLSTILKSTNNFKCKGNTAEYVTICASNVLNLDTKFRRDSNSQRFLQIIIVATKIVVAGNIPGCTPYECTVFDLNGDDGWKYKFKAHRDWSTGGNGGNFLGIALEWVNVGELQILSSPGRPGCAGDPQFDFLQEELVVNREKVRAIKPKRPIFRLTREPRKTNVANVVTYDVIDFIRVVDGLDGKPGNVLLLGERAGHIFSRTTVPRRLEKCKPVSANQVGDSGGVMNIFERVTTGTYFVRINSAKPPAIPIDRRADLLQEVRVTLINMMNDKRLTAPNIINLIKFIDSAQLKLKLDSEEGFVNELTYILKNSLKIDNFVEAPMLRMTQARILQFTGNNNHLTWLYGAAESHRHRIARDEDLITNIEGFITPFKDLVRSEATVERQAQLVSKTAADFEQATDEQIDQALKLIESTLMPELQTVEGRLKQDFERVKEELLKSIQAARQDQAVIENNLKKAVIVRATNIVFNAMKTVASSITMVQKPIGEAVGSGIMTATSVGLTLRLPLAQQRWPQGFKFPESIKNNLKPVEDWFERKRSVLVGTLQKLSVHFKNYRQTKAYFKELSEKAAKLQNEKNPRDKIKKIKEIEAAMNNKLGELRKGISNDLTGTSRVRYDPDDGSTPIQTIDITAPEDSSSQTRPTRQLPITTSESLTDSSSLELNPRQTELDNSTEPANSTELDVKKLMATAKAAADAFVLGVNEFILDTKLVDKVRVESITNRNAIDTMTSFVTKLHDDILPMAFQMFDAVKASNVELLGQTLAAIDVSTWNIRETVVDIKRHVLSTLHSFSSAGEVAYSFERVEAVLSTIAAVHTRVAEYKEKKRFADLLLGLTNPRILAQPTDKVQKKMNFIVREAAISGLVERVTFAFRMWSFPFAKVFISNLVELVSTQSEDEPMTAIMKRCAHQLDLIQNSIKQYKYSKNSEIDHHRILSAFYSEAGTPGAASFYVWKWETHQINILKFIRGESVLFNADVRRYRDEPAHGDKEAVKFASIILKFVIRGNPKAQTRFNEGLMNFRLDMTHMGLSYYNYQNKTYLFRTGPVSFSVQAGDFSGDPAKFKGQTFSMAKYTAGDGTLSPYTPWVFKLGKSIESVTYSVLQLKAGEMLDIHLIGTGYSVEPFAGQFYRDPTIDKYFRAISDDEISVGLTSRSGRKCAPKVVQEDDTPTHHHVLEDAKGEVHDTVVSASSRSALDNFS